MHLTENNIQELAYAYVTKVRLSDKQVGFKRHMADCDSCFNKFLVERKLQETLLELGLISDAVMTAVLKGEEKSSEKILFTMKKAADGFHMFIEDLKDQADSLWNFYLSPQMAFSRGENAESEAVVYENVVSEYSMIQIDENGLLIRLDESDYPAEHFILKVKRGDSEERVPFMHNEEEESYDAFVKGRVEMGTQFEIVEVKDED